MDRPIVKAGQIPLANDLLWTGRHAMVGLGRLAAAMLGTSTQLNGFTCIPSAPADLTVQVTPGEIYSLEDVDHTAIGPLASDTTHQVLKQGLLADAVTLSCPAPSTNGFSINYLIQVDYADSDDLPVVRSYYNAGDPSTPWSGPGNAGTTDPTVRHSLAVASVKAGTAAATGSQTTPAPDAGKVGAFVVTVAKGQTSITSGSISVYPGAPFIADKLSDKASVAQVVNGSLLYALTSTADGEAYTATVDASLTAFHGGTSLLFRFGDVNTVDGPTLTVNGVGPYSIYLKDFTTELPAGRLPIMARATFWPTLMGWVLENEAAAGGYGVDTASGANHIVAQMPGIRAYFPGLRVDIKVKITNTSAVTMNLSSLGAVPVTYQQDDLAAGQLVANSIYTFIYTDAGDFQLLSAPG